MSRLAVIGLVGKSLFFDVPRFHAGGETIVAKSLHEEWGGKGFNQAVAAARQGAAVSFLGAVQSADVKPLSDLCAREGVSATIVPKTTQTATAAIMTDGTGETRVTVYPGAALSPKDVNGFADAIALADFLLLNNEVPESVNLAAIEIARHYGVKVIFNPAPARKLPSAILESVFLFTPNEFEESSLNILSSPAPEIVTTLGAKGCRIRSTGEVIPAPAANAVDSTGAGDTFNAVLAVRLAEGESLRDACVAANAAAARSVAVRYVLPSLPRRDDAARKFDGRVSAARASLWNVNADNRHRHESGRVALLRDQKRTDAQERVPPVAKQATGKKCRKKPSVKGTRC